ELGEPVGERVGYTVRFEEVGGPRTRIRFLTEGVLTRRLQTDRRLDGVSIVVLDEFHERHLQTDLVLALLRRLQLTVRPDLRIVVMSATLESGPIARYLGAGAPLEIPGRQYEVRIDHPERPDSRPLAEQVRAAVAELLAAGIDGDLLVFLPGAAEIRRAGEACAELALGEDMLIVPLHGDLPAEAQDLAVRPARQRKLILSTNVAESSVTIDGVVAVIDSGLAREAGHSPWSGVSTLEVTRISQAAATQRAGRAGRTRPGVCRRLYTRQDLLTRPAFRTPEIAREDLAEPVLALLAAGVADLARFDWFEAPPKPGIEAAVVLLRRLGAIDGHDQLTETGREMLRYPVHPRQARILVEARRRGVYAGACTIVALIGERDITRRSLTDGGRREAPLPVHAGRSDLLDRADRFDEAIRYGHSRDPDLDTGAVRMVDRVRRQLLRLGPRTESNQAGSDPETSLLISILTGYPDRVARRRSAKDSAADLILATGAGAALAPGSVVRSADYLVAVDAVERGDRAGGARYRVHLASAIEPDWLIDLPGEELRELVEAKWNTRAERVEVVERMLYEQLVVNERPVTSSDRPEITELLATQALAVGWQRFVSDPDEVWRLLWRVAFVGWNFPEFGMTDIGESDIDSALVELCAGRRSFAELRVAAGKGGLVNLI
ncbi:MAG: ATP-dependent RNA helicase, partial [Acidobacteria bacterium]|nr:ATP-dependent RNA helicase [Acidobacteriota bacterium]